MPRKKFTPSKLPYHVTARCINKDWFGQPLDELWPIFCDYLYLTKILHNVKIHSFVLMNNHFHLLISAPDLNLSQAMQFFLQEVSKSILRSSGRINRTFSDRFFRSEIENFHHFMTVYKYVYRNPVEAGLSTKCEDYRFSTLNGLLGQSHLILPLEEDTLADISTIHTHLNWLNLMPTKEYRETVQKALRRSRFKLPKRNGRDHMLESHLY